MKSTSALYTSFFATVLLAAGPASAAWFLEIEGVSGESTDAKHQGWIQVQSFSLGAQSHLTLTTGDAAAAARTAGGPLKVTIRSAKAIPALNQAKGNGKGFSKVVLEGTRSDGKVYLRITLKDCLVSSYTVLGSGDAFPTETISFSYGRIETEYLEQKPTPVTGAVKPPAVVAPKR